MNRYTGKKEDFTLLKYEGSSIILCYELKKIENNLCEWYEVGLPKKHYPNLTFNNVRDTIIGDINNQTDGKILTGFVWNNIHVWLSAENQRNFSEGHRMAQEDSSILPITYKIGENDEHEPVYHTFNTFEELDDFYKQAFGYINQCLNEGWQRKDAIDWQPYKEYFPNEEPLEEEQ